MCARDSAAITMGLPAPETGPKNIGGGGVGGGGAAVSMHPTCTHANHMAASSHNTDWSLIW